MKKIKQINKPLFALAQEQLMGLIKEASIGYKLPSEENLSIELGISRNTLREAIKRLEMEGWIQQRHGVGTFVIRIPRAIDHGLERLESLDSYARRNGITCETSHIVCRYELPPADVSKVLDTDGEQKVTIVERVKKLNGVSVAFLIDYVPGSLIPFPELEGKPDQSILDMIIENYEEDIDYTYTELSPLLADAALAEKLSIKKGSILMRSEETIMSNAGTVMEFAVTYMVADQFNYHVIRRLKK